MSFEIKYNQEELILPDIICDCGMKHMKPDMDIYIGNGILGNTVKYLKKRDYGKNVIVITDDIIYPVVGQKVEEMLIDAGYQVKLCKLEREEELLPDQTAIGEVLLTVDLDTDFMIAVGSGTINDITRYVAVNTELPFVSIGTAPSMDGYTSVIAPLIHGKLKVNKPAVSPQVLICDLEIMKEAPYQMLIAGFGDVVGKYIAIADWKLGKIINKEEYCPVTIDIVSQAVEKCINSVDGIINRTDAGVRSIIEALILAGITILIIGQTRAVASNEHNMGHYWEMMKLLRNEKPASHGIAVGVATGYAIDFYNRFLQLNLDNIDPGKVKANRLTKSEWQEELLDKYGDKVGNLILQNNPDEYLNWPEQLRRINTIKNSFKEIKKQLDFMPSSVEIRSIYEKLDFPLQSEEIGIDQQLLHNALLYAKDYRDRYTVFKSANELGLLEDLVASVIEEY